MWVCRMDVDPNDTAPELLSFVNQFCEPGVRSALMFSTTKWLEHMFPPGDTVLEALNRFPYASNANVQVIVEDKDKQRWLTYGGNVEFVKSALPDWVKSTRLKSVSTTWQFTDGENDSVTRFMW